MIIKDNIFTEQEEDNFWPVFTDLLASIVLVILLFLIFNLFMRQEQLYQLEKQEEELAYYREQMKSLIGVRSDIAQEINRAFADSKLDLDVDQQTGVISFSGNILFEFDKAVIRAEFKEKLQEFIPRYMEIILAPKYRDQIAEIIIEGHTDDLGSYMYNLELSQQRAYNVASYILSSNFSNYTEHNRLRELITANGRSKSNLIKDESGRIDREKSRRVEFKFRLKDEELMEKILEEI